LARILVTCRTCSNEFLASLERLGTVVPSSVRKLRPLTEEELLIELTGFDIVVAGTDPFTGKVIDAAKSSLRLISRYGIGTDNVDLEAATRNGILVTSAPGASANSVAEFALTLILVLLRRVVEGDAKVRKGEWGQLEMKGNEIEGKTIGIIGFGSIGKNLAGKVEALGAKVLACDPYVKGDPRLTSLEDLLRKADVITMHAALSPESESLIGKREFEMMRSGIMLVNTARGQLVDEGALYEAMVSGKVRAAALDVFRKEPPSLSDTFARMPNVVLTPHIAGNTTEASAQLDAMVLEDVSRFLEGKKPVHSANPEVLGRLGLR
jgi:phosphoglycerate dehydrogenase-like enzyme